MEKTFRQNQNIDLLFGLVGETVPTKRDDFKFVDATLINDEGVETIFRDLYIKKPTTQSVLVFQNKIRNILTTTYSDFKMIMVPNLVEVFISVGANKKRFFDVDVDNLSKTVLDSLTGHLFEDDVQVVNLIVTKYINETNGILIGLTELTETRKGLISNVHLFGPQ